MFTFLIIPKEIYIIYHCYKRLDIMLLLNLAKEFTKAFLLSKKQPQKSVKSLLTILRNTLYIFAKNSLVTFPLISVKLCVSPLDGATLDSFYSFEFIFPPFTTSIVYVTFRLSLRDGARTFLFFIFSNVISLDLVFFS